LRVDFGLNDVFVMERRGCSMEMSCLPGRCYHDVESRASAFTYIRLIYMLW
jgi:hypothetical protein